MPAIHASLNRVHIKSVLRKIKNAPKFLIAMIGVVLLTVISVIFSVNMYTSSGVSLIDLSKPGLSQVRDQVVSEEGDGNFSSNGPINPQSIKEFNQIFDKKSQRIKGLSSYAEAAVSDQNLGLSSGENAPDTEPASN